MGEAYLCRRGGNSFRGLTVISPPDKLSYYAGEYADMSGMIIGADFGTFVLRLSTETYSCAPIGRLTTNDTEITVTATVGGRTKSVGIPITVSPVSVVFGNNSWGMIAYVAASGQARNYWNVGDSKVDGGITYTIIGMDHDKLSQTDAKYSDTMYNRNIKKAALTIQIMTSAGQGMINTTNTQTGGWHACYMRNTIIQEYLEQMPDEIKTAMRTVDKTTAQGGSRNINITTSSDRLFLLNGSELFAPEERGQLVLPSESSACPQYQYYADGGARYKGSDEWTRSPLNPQDSNHYFIKIESSGPDQSYPTNEYDYFPAFCI